MLQFTLTTCPDMTLADQAAMAAKAGCAWIEIDPTNVPDDTLNTIIDTCRDNGIILVYIHNDILLEKMRVHGVHLSNGDSDPTELRNRLGGHPIIGVEITPDTPMQPLKIADVDYIVLGEYPDKTNTTIIRRLADTQSEQGISIPIVVSGRIEPSEIQSIINAGASGINIDLKSLKAPEYEISLASFITECNNIVR